MAVKATRSQKRVVTVLRSSEMAAAGAIGAAHSMQNLARTGFSAPHEGQATTSLIRTTLASHSSVSVERGPGAESREDLAGRGERRCRLRHLAERHQASPLARAAPAPPRRGCRTRTSGRRRRQSPPQPHGARRAPRSPAPGPWQRRAGRGAAAGHRCSWPSSRQRGVGPPSPYVPPKGRNSHHQNPPGFRKAASARARSSSASSRSPTANRAAAATGAQPAAVCPAV